MTHLVRDTAGAAINAQWRAQQAKQQAAKPTPVIHPATPKPTGETPAECQNCVVVKECKNVLKMWYKKKPRPELVRAWVRLVDEHAAEMVCLSGLREKDEQDNRFSLRVQNDD